MENHMGQKKLTPCMLEVEAHHSWIIIKLFKLLEEVEVVLFGSALRANL
jgi:predicted nucleotidyltransferase